MKRKSYLLVSYGEIRKLSKTSYQKYLKAVKSGDYERQKEAWNNGKLIGVLDADVTDLNEDDADFKLQCLT